MQETFEFEAIGTHWQLTFDDQPVTTSIAQLQQKVLARIDQFDQTYSRFRSDSLVCKMSKQAGTYQLPEDALPLLKLYEQLYQVSDGLFTPLIGQVLADAGYDHQYSFKAKKLVPPASWDETLAYEHPQLKLKKPALLDFGAAGKGYLVDIIGDLLEKEGVDSYCIDASGDIRVRGLANAENAPLRVGLEHPADATQVIGVAEISNQSICGSATNRRAWGDFHHIFHPKLLSPVKNITATWVVAETTLLADALATALFLLPAQQLEAVFDFEYLLITTQGRVQISKHFPAEIFYQVQSNS